MEQCTSAGLALHFDGSAVLLHDTVSYGQAKPRTLPRGLCSEEWVVDARQVIVSDTLPGVLDIDPGARAVVPGPDSEGAAAVHRVARIQDKVEENLLQFSGVPFTDNGSD